MTGLRRLAADERGFTIVELLLSMLIGSAVLMAMFLITSAAMRTSNNVIDRVDASQRGRSAIEQLVQDVRSSICLDKNPPIVANSTGSALTYYAAPTAPSGNGTTAFTVEKRTLTFANGAITESRQAPSAGTYPNYTWGAASTRTVVTKVRQRPGVPVFSYYAYPVGGTIDPYSATPTPPLTVPLNATDATRTGAVRIAFLAGPGRARGSANDTAGDSAFDELVDLRLVDPTAPDKGPVCRM